MLDVPDATPVKQRCDSCGFPADVALVMPDGDVATACWRHRIDLPPVPAGTRRVERLYGRWYGGRVSVAELIGSTLYLACENCGATGVVVYELTTDDASWKTVACLRCVPPSRTTHAGADVHALAARTDDGSDTGAWQAAARDWWPRTRHTRRP